MDNQELFMESFKLLLGLEKLGIRIEDTKEDVESGKTIYYFSVPEFSILEIENKELNNKIKTADGLKLIAKELLTEMVINACEAQYPDEEFITDVKNNISEYFKFYAKVRNGETWNQELSDNRVKELIEDLQNASQYKEV